MKISQYIKCLQVIRETHGDLEVEKYSVCRDRVQAPPPEIAFRRVLRARERKPEFFWSIDPKNRKGEKVCRV